MEAEAEPSPVDLLVSVILRLMLLLSSRSPPSLASPPVCGSLVEVVLAEKRGFREMTFKF